MRRAAALLLLCVVLGLSSCARTGPPAPVFSYGLNTRENLSALVRRETSPPAVRDAGRIATQDTVRASKRSNIVSSFGRPYPPAFAHWSPAVPQGGRGGLQFIWPVRGRVVSGYGPKPGGLYNDGINIAAPRGMAVRAVSDGTVAYVGDKLGGYGNLILIRHMDGIMTAYAHLGLVTVKQGAQVKKGQAIGGVGATGGVPSPQLHFEIRKGGDAVDPARYLG